MTPALCRDVIVGRAGGRDVSVAALVKWHYQGQSALLKGEEGPYDWAVTRDRINDVTVTQESAP